MSFPEKDIYHNIALGKESYIKKIESKITAIREKREIQTTKYQGYYSPEKMIIKVSQIFNLIKEKVLKKQRGNFYRQITLCLVKRHSSLFLKKIGKIFYMDYIAVSLIVRRFELKIKQDNKIKTKTDSVLELLNCNESQR